MQAQGPALVTDLLQDFVYRDEHLADSIARRFAKAATR
jgi:hypothetical protein